MAVGDHYADAIRILDAEFNSRWRGCPPAAVAAYAVAALADSRLWLQGPLPEYAEAVDEHDEPCSSLFEGAALLSMRGLAELVGARYTIPNFRPMRRRIPEDVAADEDPETDAKLLKAFEFCERWLWPNVVASLMLQATGAYKAAKANVEDPDGDALSEWIPGLDLPWINRFFVSKACFIGAERLSLTRELAQARIASVLGLARELWRSLKVERYRPGESDIPATVVHRVDLRDLLLRVSNAEVERMLEGLVDRAISRGRRIDYIAVGYSSFGVGFTRARLAGYGA